MKLIAIRSGEVVMDVGRLSGGDPGPYCNCPIMSFLVLSGPHVVLFDTGMNPAVRADPVQYWGRVSNRVLVPHLPEGEDLLQRLRDLGHPPETVTLILNSHLHNDHAGTNREFPGARVRVRRQEWEHALTLMDEPSSGYVRNDFHDEGALPELFDYENSHDVLGDGRVVLLSTRGHTPGHQSLQVTFPSGRRFVLTGDAAYTEHALNEAHAPSIAWRPEMAARSAGLLRELRAQGATVLVCHDEPTWESVRDFATLHEEE